MKSKPILASRLRIGERSPQRSRRRPRIALSCEPNDVAMRFLLGLASKEKGMGHQLMPHTV